MKYSSRLLPAVSVSRHKCALVRDTNVSEIFFCLWRMTINALHIVLSTQQRITILNLCSDWDLFTLIVLRWAPLEVNRHTSANRKEMRIPNNEQKDSSRFKRNPPNGNKARKKCEVFSHKNPLKRKIARTKRLKWNKNITFLFMILQNEFFFITFLT